MHDIALRRAILRERDLKRLAAFPDMSFLETYVNDKLIRAKQGRRAASELARTIRTLAAAPTATSPLPPQPVNEPTPPAVPETVTTPTKPASPQRIEPLILTIGTGYAG